MMDCEVSSRKVLPAIRKEIVINLIKLGKKQKEIAKLLEVTPAAITQYVKGKRAKINLTASEKQNTIKIAKLIFENKKSKKEICNLCKKISQRINK